MEGLRLLKLLEYPDDAIVSAMVQEYGVTEAEAKTLVAAN